ncbi:MAG: hypothetical protein ABI321_17545, partial [Polyangia bacterium]
ITKDFATAGGDGGQNNGGDGGGSTDMAVKPYIETSAHAIDTASIGDPLAVTGAAVTLKNLIILAPPVGFSAKFNGTAKAGCRYEVWAEDTGCTTAPCGVVLETNVIANPMGVGAFCPYASATTTALKDTWRGDVVTVNGVTDLYTPANPDGSANTITQHGVDIDSLTTTTVKGNLPAPMVVTDSATTIFTPYAPTGGFKQYEGTYIELKPASGKFTTTLTSNAAFKTMCPNKTGLYNGSFTVAPGGAAFSDTFAAFYLNKDAGQATNCDPADGSMYSSISAIVSAGFGGSLLPTLESDFQP